MARRKRKRFGSAPAVHIKVAANTARRAARAAREALREIKAGKCHAGWIYLRAALERDAIARTHAGSAGVRIVGRTRKAWKISNRAEASVDKARRAFIVKCIVR